MLYHTVDFMSYRLCIVYISPIESKRLISEQQGKNSCLPNVLHTCTSAPLEMLPVSLVSWRHLHERPCLEVTGKTEHSPVSPTKREIAGYFSGVGSLHGPRKVLPKDSSPIVFSLRLFKNKCHCKENMPNTKLHGTKLAPAAVPKIISGSQYM